jgi:hypothetical protein
MRITSPPPRLRLRSGPKPGLRAEGLILASDQYCTGIQGSDEHDAVGARKLRMLLVDIVSGSEDHNYRSFECEKCDHATTVARVRPARQVERGPQWRRRLHQETCPHQVRETVLRSPATPWIRSCEGSEYLEVAGADATGSRRVAVIDPGGVSFTQTNHATLPAQKALCQRINLQTDYRTTRRLEVEHALAVSSNGIPPSFPPCPTCKKETRFISISPTCQSVIYEYMCSGDGDRLIWETRQSHHRCSNAA